MRHSAHRADSATSGISASNSTVSSQRSHVATSHRAQRQWFKTSSITTSVSSSSAAQKATSHRASSQSSTSHRTSQRSGSLRPGSARNSGRHSALSLSRLSPTKLIAVLGMTTILGAAGISTAANASNIPVLATSSNVASASSVSSVSTQAASTSGSAVSRSSTRTSAAKTEGAWSLEGSEADSLNTQKVSVATASNAVVQQRLQQDADLVPAGFDPNHATGDTGNAYSFSQCTWWVYVRRHQLGLPAGSHMGDGAQWANTAKKLGYWVDTNPQVGDVMVFQRGQEGMSSTYGHVAIVEKVENGTVTTSEMGVNLQGSTFSRTFSNIHDFEYIHY